MSRREKWLALVAAAAIVFLRTVNFATACSVPVFRYALERWPADSYELLIFHRRALDKPSKAVFDAFRAAADTGKAFVNFDVKLINLDKPLPPEEEAIWKAQKSPDVPWAVLRYPSAPPEAPSAWAGPLISKDLKVLLDSPKRRELASRLLKGESVVWLLLESDDKAGNEAAAKLLSEQLTKLQKTLELPKIDPDDPDIPGPKLRSSLPLKLAFSSLRISRTDPAEKLLVSILMSGYGEAPPDGPIVVPVYGRGRALALLGGKELDADNIAEAAKFLIGECSCQVKAMNPGIDLLLAADWEALVDDEKPRTPVIPEIPVP